MNKDENTKQNLGIQDQIKKQNESIIDLTHLGVRSFRIQQHIDNINKIDPDNSCDHKIIETINLFHSKGCYDKHRIILHNNSSTNYNDTTGYHLVMQIRKKFVSDTISCSIPLSHLHYPCQH